MAYQPTNSIFLSHQISQQYFQPWLIRQTSPNEQGELNFRIIQNLTQRQQVVTNKAVATVAGKQKIIVENGNQSGQKNTHRMKYC